MAFRSIELGMSLHPRLEALEFHGCKSFLQYLRVTEAHLSNAKREFSVRQPSRVRPSHKTPKTSAETLPPRSRITPHLKGRPDNALRSAFGNAPGPGPSSPYVSGPIEIPKVRSMHFLKKVLSPPVRGRLPIVVGSGLLPSHAMTT